MSVTLDGFSAGLNDEMDWVTDNLDEEIMKFIDDELSTRGAILLGRVTYQIWTNYWPSATGSIADKIKNLPKIVFSRTLQKVEWGNTTLIKDNIAEEIQKLKRQPGKNLLLQGGAGLAQTFMQLGLIDEYQLLVYPVILGSGKPLFKDLQNRIKLKLLEAKTFTSGVVLLRYQPEEMI